MRLYLPAALITAAAALALFGCGQSNTQADPQQQAAADWYNQHQGNLPEGLRPEDRLTADQESRLKVGVVLDNDIRDKVRPAPQDLSDRLAPPPPDHRYVAVGGHVGLVDKNFQVKALIQLHDK
jgi:hypothetical protein